MGRYCGSTPPQALTSRARMRLHFVTDATVTDKGWMVEYWVRECGGNLTSPQGTLASPTHPDTYHHNADCTWVITVGLDRVIRLK